MFAAIRCPISAMPVVTTGIVMKCKRSDSRLCIVIIGLLFAFVCPFTAAQSNQEWLAYKRNCGIPMGLDYASWVRQGSHCPAREAGPSNNNNNAVDANAAAEAEAAAEAKRRRDEELKQQRIDAEKQRLAEEAEKQAQFDRDKREALGQLKRAANGDDFDSASGLKGVGSADSGLKDTWNPGGSSGLKTLSDVNTDPMVVDARNVPTGLPKSVAAEIPDTPAGNRVRKGFEAIQAHDWPVALAWFKDALNHDPGNAGIQRLIELAQFTMEREERPHPSSTPAKPAPATHAQVKAAPVDPDRLMDTQMNADDLAAERDRQALNKQLDTQMNADLAKSIDAFNRNYFLRHPELPKPAKPSSPAQATKPATVAPAPGEQSADQNPKWKLFFDSIFAPTPIDRAPRSVSGVRD
jgi:hypothetical protein